MIKGNKGEWSEIYVLLKLLGDGKIYAADEKLKRIESLYFPILNIIRMETPLLKYIYRIDEASNRIQVFLNGENIAEYDAITFNKKANELYDALISIRSKSSFRVEKAEEFIRKIGCTKLKAPPVKIGNSKLGKTDITMKIHDPITGHEPTSGFSIKSEIGRPPTLLNAGKTTNFIYEIKGLSPTDISEINAIKTRTKIIDRIKMIKEKCSSFSYVGMSDETFNSNLEVVDSRLGELLSYALIYYYDKDVSTSEQAVIKLTKENPLNVKSPKYFYENKFKKFLTAVALGMVPSKSWNGRDEAAGGYIIVTTNGDVLAYHIYNRDSFEEYLLKNTKFEKASTTRHQFASLYSINNKVFIKLNMQIRFLK